MTSEIRPAVAELGPEKGRFGARSKLVPYQFVMMHGTAVAKLEGEAVRLLLSRLRIGKRNTQSRLGGSLALPACL